MAQSYFVVGEREQGIDSALAFGEHTLQLSGTSNPDIIILRFGLFSVDDARRLSDTAYRSSSGNSGKLVIASGTRFFHEAQNALLKLFEEPPKGVTLVLVIPSEGLLLPTLRSRLLRLPIESRAEIQGGGREVTETGIAAQFLLASTPEREKIITKLLERTKSDKDEVKQESRAEAVQLVEGLTKSAYSLLKTTPSVPERQDLLTFLEDLATFAPILHERSAPLKLIFEHLLLVIPTGLVKREV